MILALTMAGLPPGAPAADHATVLAGARPPVSEKKVHSMKIRLTVNGKLINATLADNPSARDFLALLPLSLTLKDYASTEKISDLPKKLTTQGAPAGIDPELGDITYYAPWGNLAIFYRDFGYSAGLIKLGHIDAGMEALNISGPLQVTIEAENP
ncbi:MAG: hypothetical protein E6R11_07055 [Rhodocyclaceae bacterium]|nr:MAG: hypothetical protein E6R11_07055 [Rhodocyclaceae bacterium]